MGESEPMRLLIYSHDTFGLGHLRRCRAIAHSLVDHRRDVSALILSGSPIIGSYDFRSRVDFVRFPGVVKLRNGSYTARGLDISIEDAIAIRETIIRSAAETFNPDIFLVDKEPLGLRGEVTDTLNMLRARGTRIVLGLRDVLDEGEVLNREWERKGALEAIRNLYDDVWIYGCEAVCDPLADVKLPKAVRDKITFTGYLRRPYVPASGSGLPDGLALDDPFLLVTTGGGGDGASLVDWVLRAYEHDPQIPYRALIVFGPFMHNEMQADFRHRIESLSNVQAVPFISNVEEVMAGAVGVVAMGGYNTVCEILSFDRPGLIVPRTTPRLEQYIRAQRMSELGLLQMLADDGLREPEQMAKALRELPFLPRPSEVNIPGLLDGFATINAMVDHWLTSLPNKGPALEVVGAG